MSAYNFNSDDVPPDERGDFELIPAGWYSAVITDAGIKETRDGGGRYVSVTWTLENGRKVWENCNIENANSKAVEIGRRQLASICYAVVLRAFADTDQLIGRGGEVKVKIKPGSNGYEARNEIAAHRYPEGVAQQGPPDRGNPPPPDDEPPF